MLILKHNDKNVTKECIHLLSRPGSVLLLPTETVYGLVCTWNDAKAVKLINEIKGRDADKPLQMLVSGLDSVENEGGIITNEIRKISDAFCPGPITIITKQDDKKSTIGFRMPDHGLICDILSNYDKNLAATSANLAGSPPATTIDEALSVLHCIPNLVVDAGPIDGEASTVVDMSGPFFKILRNGPISESEISNVLV